MGFMFAKGSACGSGQCSGRRGIIMGRASLVVAVLILCLPGADAAPTNVWTGAAGKNWFLDGSWSQGHFPVNGEHVVVPNVANDVLLTNSTASLGSFSITNETLTCSNWSARIIATNVYVRNLGKLSLPPPFAVGTMSNRIWITCTNLFVCPGGQIDADYKGYMVAQGPGKGSQSGSNNNGGGGYGGRGGDEAGGTGGSTYGLTNAPTHPGSGGGRWTSSPLSDGSGGGVILIGAANVLISGTISARGKVGQPYDGGGSGGSVYIACSTFGGTGGVIRVDGGEGGIYYGGGGGGGRIAVTYGSIVGAPSVEFSANAGLLYTREAAGYGTVYLPNTALVSAPTLGTRFKNVRLVIPGFTSWNVSSLAVTNVAISMGEKSFCLTVTNDLVVGQGAKLTLGGVPLVSTNSLSAGGSGTNPWVRVGNNMTVNGGALLLGGRSQPSRSRMTVGGNLLLTNGGDIVVYGSPTNATVGTGAWVVVTGSVNIASSGSWVYPIANSTNGGTCLFDMGNLTIKPGGGFYASFSGYGIQYGPGKGRNDGSRGSGGGYGGKGANNGVAGSGGSVYGTTNRPFQAGSGGGSYNTESGAGGGAIRIRATAVTLDGSLVTDGEYGGSYNGGGSGGGIFVICDSFAGTSNGVLSAKGGNARSDITCGGGGGGRISVAVGLSATDRLRLFQGLTVTNLYAYPRHSAFYGSRIVTGGTGYNVGSNGSQVFLTTYKSVTVVGDAGDFGSPAPQGYGTQAYPAGSPWVTNRVTSPANQVGGLRRACIGWALKTALGAPVSSGTTTQAVFQVTTNLVLTWKWTNQYYLSVSAGPNGTATVSKTGWYTNAVVVSGIGAGPDAGYMFNLWSGDVPAANDTDIPLTLTMTQARTIMANFSSAVGADKNWTGTGAWEDSARWSPAGMPGPGDRCVLRSGTCKFANRRVVNTLVISNTATLLFTNWTSRIKATNLTILSGGTITLPTPTGLGQPTNRIQILCTSNFLVRSGGLINADNRGYWVHEGPGKGDQGGSNNNGGGGHGGRGGDEGGGMGGIVYDSASAPSQPGSGGGQYLSDAGGNGGGMIRVDATNCVVAGTISANGETGSTYNGGGSGGSIHIVCKTFTGTGGVIRANGGSGGSAYSGGGGGGGRIAVVYQSLRGSPNVQFGASAGALYINHAPGMGTLYLPDTALLSPNMSMFKDVRLSIPGFTSWTVASLVISNTSLALADTNFTLTVTGNMTIRNGGWLSVGGVALSDGRAIGRGIGATNGILRVGGNLLVDNSRLTLSGTGGLAKSAMTVGGMLTATNGAQLHIYAGRTNGAGTHGAYVTVTGNVTLTKNSWVYPVSHATNGASVLFRTGNLTVSTNSGFNADGRGYTAANGPGKGKNSSSSGNSGGGYGGNGGDSSVLTGGAKYGTTNAPVYPGSGGGKYDGNGGNGGGLIRIEAANVVMNGTLSATASSGSGQYNGGGSGGGILVICSTFQGGTVASMNVNGGPKGTGYTTLGGGGGGRIAVWYGTISSADKQKIFNNQPVVGLVVSNSYVNYLGTILKNGGTGYDNGDPGTAVFLTVRAASKGTIFTFL